MPLIVGHRGASFDAPENTLAAFRLAFEQGADAIEADFHQTADGQIVCIHDLRTERTGGRDLVVAQSTLAELKTLDVGSRKDPRFAGERIPTLAEVLSTVPAGKCAFLEIKSAPTAVAPIAAAIAAAPVPASHIQFISFRADVVAACKQALPDVPAFWLIDFPKLLGNDRGEMTTSRIMETLANCRADGLSPEARPDTVTPELVKALRHAGLAFHTWTIDSPELADHFAALGVDSITTNRPAMIRAHLAATRRLS